MFKIKSSWSDVVSTRRSIVLILPDQKGFPGNVNLQCKLTLESGRKKHSSLLWCGINGRKKVERPRQKGVRQKILSNRCRQSKKVWMVSWKMALSHLIKRRLLLSSYTLRRRRQLVGRHDTQHIIWVIATLSITTLNTECHLCRVSQISLLCWLSLVLVSLCWMSWC